MPNIEQTLAVWRSSLVPAIPIGRLRARNPVAYKWKASFRTWLLREATFWRITDLLTQSKKLFDDGHGLGARILLRSGFETLATIVNLNQLISDVLTHSLEFHEFSKKTSVLLLGSRDGSTDLVAINILTILQKCEKRYPGLSKLYGSLSESAHPNSEGLLLGYTQHGSDLYEINFSNRWMQVYGRSYPDTLILCMETFLYEYNEVWPERIDALEAWLENNDVTLEATKNSVQWG